MHLKRCFLILTLLFLFSTVACRERVANGSLENSGRATSAAAMTSKPGHSDVTPPKSSPSPAGSLPIAETAPSALGPVPLSDAQPLQELPTGLLIALGSKDKGWDLKVAAEDGQLRTLVEQVAPAHYWPDFDISPDGRQLLYAAAGDIWLLDIASGVKENVTNTPKRREQVPRWLPAGNGFVCGSLSIPEPPEMEGVPIGYLTLVFFDGQYEVVVSEGTLAAPPAPAPDGESIAYSRSHQRQVLPFLYRTDVGERQVDLGSPDLDWVEKMWEASWSPDGRELAWTVAGEREGEWLAAEILLHLEDDTHILLHSYRPVGMGGYLPAPRWAPDGSWLSFMVLDIDASAGGLWWLDLNSGEKVQLSAEFVRSAIVSHPAVAPDGAWIAAPTYDGSAVGLIDTATHQVLTWTTASSVAAVGWVDLQTQ